MKFRFDQELEDFAAEVRAFFREEMDPGRTRGHEDPSDLTGFDEEFERALLGRCGRRGYLGISVPSEYGGGGKPLRFKAAFGFEAAYAGAPAIDTPLTLVGSQMLEFGSAEQKSWFMPRMVLGEGLMCIAYTEPEAGSDLTRISTTARAEGSEIVLNGVKSLVTAAHKSDHVCLVARSDPESDARRGMSMFLVALDTPGIHVKRQATASGWTLGEIHFEGARVPESALLGEWNAGWRQMASAILAERSGMFHLGWATRSFEELVTLCREGAFVVAPRTLVRQRIAALECELDIARRFCLRVLGLQDQGEAPISEAAMAKIYVTELLQRIAQTATELMGPFGALRPGSPRAPAGGRFCYDVIERIHPAISVGSNEIQRNTVAQMGLGLPR